MIPKHFLESVKYELALRTALRVAPQLYSLKVSQLLFTYLLPLGPILIFWDGLVSCLRTYFAADLELMTDIGKTGVVKLPKGGGAFPWLTGRPL